MLTSDGSYVPSHGTTVVYTRRIRDFFAKRYMIYCWFCTDKWGPFSSEETARALANELRSQVCRHDEGQQVY